MGKNVEEYQMAFEKWLSTQFKAVELLFIEWHLIAESYFQLGVA